MIKLKNKWLVYKNLMIYLVLNQNKDSSKLSGLYRSIKFEVKLYLIALSFNRFLFNFDKIIFVLCIITNFLYFISFRSPRVLFFGEYSETYELILKKAAKVCNQTYYSKCLLPGSIVNIDPIDPYYKNFGNATFPKHLDCVFSFFCNPILQELKEISTLGIPIIGLVEFTSTNLQFITHPLVCVKHVKSVYFFSNYFAKILNSFDCDYASKLSFNYQTRHNGLTFINKNRQYYTTKIGVDAVYALFNKITGYATLYDQFFFMNLTVFTTRDILFSYNKLQFNSKGTATNIAITNTQNFKSFLLKNIVTNWFLFESKYFKFNKKEYPKWFKNKQIYDANKKNLKYKLNKKTITLRVKKLNSKQKKKQKLGLTLDNFVSDFRKSISAARRDKRAKILSRLETFNFSSWAVNLRRMLKKKNIYGNRSLTDRDKRFFLREFIISDLENYNITTCMLRSKNQIIKDRFPYIGKFVKRTYVPKQSSPINTIVGSWAYRKSKLFTVTEMPKKRKRIKRLKLFWKLRWLIKLQKRGTMRRYIYTKRIRANIIKRKILIRKMINYYYNFSYNKKVHSLVVFSNKLKNKVTTNSGLNLLNVFESHLSVFIMRCKFVSNMLDSKSLITSGKVLVNGLVIYNPGYILNSTDIIQIKPSYFNKFFRKYIRINKPSRWRKNRYFYRLTTKNRATQAFKNRKSFFRLSIARKSRLLYYYKFFWKVRKYSRSFFLKFLSSNLGL